MLWIILFFVIAIVSLIVGLIWDKLDERGYSDAPEVFYAISITVTGIGVILLLTLIDQKSNFNKFINEYDSVKANIEAYQSGDYGNMSSLIDKTIHLNSVIAKHKAKVNSVWSSVWFSKDIAELEPLIVFKNTNETNGNGY